MHTLSCIKHHNSDVHGVDFFYDRYFHTGSIQKWVNININIWVVSPYLIFFLNTVVMYKFFLNTMIIYKYLFLNTIIMYKYLSEQMQCAKIHVLVGTRTMYQLSLFLLSTVGLQILFYKCPMTFHIQIGHSMDVALITSPLSQTNQKTRSDSTNLCLSVEENYFVFSNQSWFQQLNS